MIPLYCHFTLNHDMLLSCICTPPTVQCGISMGPKCCTKMLISTYACTHVHCAYSWPQADAHLLTWALPGYSFLQQARRLESSPPAWHICASACMSSSRKKTNSLWDTIHVISSEHHLPANFLLLLHPHPDAKHSIALL